MIGQIDAPSPSAGLTGLAASEAGAQQVGRPLATVSVSEIQLHHEIIFRLRPAAPKSAETRDCVAAAHDFHMTMRL